MFSSYIFKLCLHNQGPTAKNQVNVNAVTYKYSRLQHHKQVSTMNQQLLPPPESDHLLHDLCRTPFSWNGAWRSRFGKSKRISEMHLATIVLIPVLHPLSPPLSSPRLHYPWWQWRNFLQNDGRPIFSQTVANLILSAMQKGREGWAALLDQEASGMRMGVPGRRIFPSLKVIVRSIWSWILLEFLRRCKPIFSIGDKFWSTMNFDGDSRLVLHQVENW